MYTLEEFLKQPILIIDSYRPSRLTPVYAMILGFIATLLAYLGSGPSWQNVRDLSVACRWNWWNNLLYVNNYVRSYELEASNRIYLMIGLLHLILALKHFTHYIC